MKGMELSRRFWENVGRPAYERLLPELLSRAAVGLAGEGSECFGYDDEISRDHDWGPGFCLWLTAADMEDLGSRAEKVWGLLPRTYMGFSRERESDLSAGRIGVMEIGTFYYRLLGIDHLPESIREWHRLPETGLAAATNGEIIADPVGEFTRFREGLLAYYPEDVWKKRLAARCALAAQAGQYNYGRCMARGERTAAFSALAQFVDHAEAIVYLLNRRYRPYYKWARRGMERCPVLGPEIGALLDRLTDDAASRTERIETISRLIIRELRRQGLSDGESGFLLPHAREIQASIRDPLLARLHLMTE